jgi:hypothetical protein
MSACNPIINYSFAEGSHYTHCNGAKLKKDMSKSTFKILFYLRKNYLNKEGKAGIMIRLSLNGKESNRWQQTGTDHKQAADWRMVQRAMEEISTRIAAVSERAKKK